MREVRMSVGNALISREETAPVFEVRGDGGVLIGELTVSTSSVRWGPSHGRSAHFLE